MKRKFFAVSVISLIVVEVFVICLMYKSYTNGRILSEEDKNVVNNQLVFYVQDAKGSTKYNKSSDSKFPSGYYLNEDKSVCVDIYGNKLEGILNGTSDTITVSSKYTVYCEIYLDLDEPAGDPIGKKIRNSNPSNLSTTLYAQLFRYQGNKETVNNNYICFGTSNKSTCVNNKERYMYRIIGINGTFEVKIIKLEYFSDYYIDHFTPDALEDVSYDTSEIRSSFNGSKFLENTEYVPSGWENKIVSTTWRYGHTGDVDQSSLYDGSFMIPLETGNMTVTYNTKLNILSNGFSFNTARKAWTDTVTDKIGMLYIHDYLCAYEGCRPLNSTNAKTSWLTPTRNEWTMSFYGVGEPMWGIGQRIYFISDSGSISAELYSRGKFYYTSCMTSTHDSSKCLGMATARPVFYINGKYKGGSGTESDPYLIN